MKTIADIPLAQYDAEGKIVPLPDETPEETLKRESKILYATGQSNNHPDDIAPPLDEGTIDPPPSYDSTESSEVEEGGDDSSSYTRRGRRGR